MPTGQQLYDKVKSYVTSGSWGYLFDGHGKEMTEALKKQYQGYYPAPRDATAQDRYDNVAKSYTLWKGRYVTDCSGAVWKAMNDLGVSASRFYTGSIPWKEPKSAISTLPNQVGILLWKDGHVAVYDGNGGTAEARNTATGFVLGKKSDVAYTHWGYLDGFTYPTSSGGGGGTTFRPYRNLSEGSDGADVQEMKKALNSKYSGSSLDINNSYFGTSTKQTVINYQKSVGLTADGICGRNTWTKLGFSPNY